MIASTLFRLPLRAPASSSAVQAAPIRSIGDVFRRFWPFARPYRRTLWLSLIFVAGAPAVDAATVWIYKLLVDDVVVPLDFAPLPPLAAAYVALTLLSGVVSFGDRSLSAWIGQQFVVGLRTAFFRHLQGLSLEFFERKRLGDVLSRLTSDIASIETFVLSGVVDALSYTLRIAFFEVALFLVDWRLALVTLAVAGALWLVTCRFAAPIKAASREKRRRAGALGAIAEESLSNAMLVQAYNREALEVARFHEQSLASCEAELASTRLKALFSPVVDLVQAAGLLIVIALGTFELQHNALTLGGLLVFLTYLARLYTPIRGLTDLSNTIFAASAAAERVLEYLDHPPALPSTQGANPVATAAVTSAQRLEPSSGARGVVVFDAVSFAYPGGRGDALGNVSFRVRPGEMLAIVGASGAGKSTISRLLLRFYDPSVGRILLDDRDLRDLDVRHLREQIAILLQETLIFDGSIAENIAYGRIGATQAEIVEAAQAADAHAFISAFPHGYATRIGQKGRSLSGGQRQRIAIARAMLRNAPILLLDEPTTGLDAESSQRVLAPMRRLTSGRTSIVVSHNLRTVRDATRILVLDKGQVVEQGTHQDLLRNDNVYARLYRLHDAGIALA